MKACNWLIEQPEGSSLILNAIAHRSSSILFLLMPIVLGGIAIIPLFSIAGWNTSTILSAALVLFISFMAAWHLYALHRSIAERLSYQYKRTQKDNCNFCKQIFPIWSTQIEKSRSIGENAVTELTTIFGAIVTRLASVLKASGSSTTNGQEQSDEFDLLGAIGSSQEDFKSLFNDLKDSLNSVNNSKELILAEVKKYSRNMEEIAEDTQKMAMQSQMVALNAQIEAARLGDDGKAFTAVVSEMRSLAKETAETSKIMAKKVCSIDETIGRLDEFYQDGQELSDIGEHSLARAESMFNDIIQRFSHITKELEKNILIMESESRQVKDDISSAMMVLQFQDRLGQVLDHVSDNIIELKDSSGLGVRKIDASVWINDMESKYSVDDEFSNAGSKQDNFETAGLVTFF